MDWRLHPQIEDFFAKPGTGCDMCVTAGSVKDLIAQETQQLFLKQIEISRRLHDCQAVVLTMHMDCGAYGGAAAFADRNAEIANCKEQLDLAKKIVEQANPGLPVETYIIGLERSPEGWNIEPQLV